MGLCRLENVGGEGEGGKGLRHQSTCGQAPEPARIPVTQLGQEVRPQGQLGLAAELN